MYKIKYPGKSWDIFIIIEKSFTFLLKYAILKIMKGK